MEKIYIVNNMFEYALVATRNLLLKKKHLIKSRLK